MKVVALLTAGWIGLLAGTASAADVDFAHDVVPVLREFCGKCHTGAEKRGGFSMNSREAVLAGGDNGAAVVLRKSAESELVKRITSADPDVRMPPEGTRVPAEKVAVLQRWIDAGLPWEQGFAFQKSPYDPPLKPRRPASPPAVMGREHPVDRLVDAYFAKRNVPRPGVVDDAIFLRRVSLDITGLLPEPDQLAAFLSDQRPDKRQRLVRELLNDDVAYADHWLSFWNDLLRNDYTGTGFITGGRKQITTWLYRSLVENKRYDQLVRELISPTAESEGFVQGIRWRGTVNSSQTQEIQFAQNVTQAFLGINMKCASCHNSFIDRWTLDETYGIAAIYATAPLEIHRCDKPTGAKAKAAWMFPELGQIAADAPQPERLKQLAALMTHADNGRFTRTIVNRFWHRLLGRGIVHPVDAMQTEPWDADLLDFLATDFVDHGYDLKQILELICTSEIYQAQAPPRGKPDGAPYVFRGPEPRRLTAEQFMDTVWQITGGAPAKPDAVVVRARINSGPAEEKKQPAATALSAAWVWSVPNASGAIPKAGESLTLQRKFDLKAMPVRAVAAITCDNSYTLFVNGQKVLADDNWETVEAVGLESQLKVGVNEIVIVAKNGGSSPNPAGLFFEARLFAADGTSQMIGTDAEWKWTSQAPDGRGRFPKGKEPTDWQSAAVIADPAVWAGRVGDQLLTALTQATTSPLRMVRASLVKSDALMRSLGRPNRDQIVTMRPTELTTLEAIDLANGQSLADVMEQGASRLLAQHGATADELTKWVYQLALSRSPAAGELAVAKEMLGEMSPANVADLLWSICMLPEFQFVR